MEKIYSGIDFHKNKCVIYTTDQQGELVSGIARVKSINTKSLLTHFSQQQKTVIAIEATGGCNPYAEKLLAQGHEVHIINPNKFRGIGVSGKKTDERDAKALNTFIRLNPNSDCEVHLRSEGSRKIKSLIVARELTVRARVNITNHIRGTLRELSITIAQGAESFFKEAPEAIQGVGDHFIRETLGELYLQARNLKEQEKQVAERINFLAQNNEQVRRLQTIPGIGPLTAITMFAIVDEVSRFPNADRFASYLGLVPSVTASADKCMMGSITRSGSEILRRYLIHGARSWLKGKAVKGKADPVRKWAEEVEVRRGTNKAVVALARKMSRIAFAVLRDGSEYKEFAFENKAC